MFYHYSSAEPPAVIPVTLQALSAEGVDCGKAGKSAWASPQLCRLKPA
jgi:hypothetical protein